MDAKRTNEDETREERRKRMTKQERFERKKRRMEEERARKSVDAKKRGEK